MLFEQGIDREHSPVSRFRKHRHDILNQLQLIRAYVQIGRESDAIRIVDETAKWLQSLTKWQTHFKGNTEKLVFAASNCPHLFLVSVDELEDFDVLLVDELEQTMLLLEQCASEKGWSPIPLRLHGPVKKGDPIQLDVELSNQKHDAERDLVLPGEESRRRIRVQFT